MDINEIICQTLCSTDLWLLCVKADQWRSQGVCSKLSAASLPERVKGLNFPWWKKREEKCSILNKWKLFLRYTVIAIFSPVTFSPVASDLFFDVDINPSIYAPLSEWSKSVSLSGRDVARCDDLLIFTENSIDYHYHCGCVYVFVNLSQQRDWRGGGERSAGPNTYIDAARMQSCDILG